VSVEHERPLSFCCADGLSSIVPIALATTLFGKEGRKKERKKERKVVL
jgi:hypothetical protein